VGAEKIQAYIEQKLGIKEGETTTDGLFTLKMMECLGGCGYGPLFQIGKNFYQNLDERKVDEILAGCRQGTIPTTVEAIGTIESLTF
jgi:NADH-quinone oxidoreductase subunit E